MPARHECAAGQSPGKGTSGPKVLSVARANNVSIMLTRFADFEGAPQKLHQALLTGNAFSAEQLSLLLQVGAAAIGILALPKPVMAGC